MVYLILVEYIVRNVGSTSVEFISGYSLRPDFYNFVIDIAPANVVHKQTDVTLDDEYLLHDTVAPHVFRVPHVDQI